MKKLALYLSVIVIIIVADQWSKIYVSQNFRLYESVKVIDGFLNFTFAKNTGAAFSFGGGFSDWVRTVLFKILPVIACFWLFKLLYNSLKESVLMSWAYTLILGGAIGNLIDRIRLDYVVDFIAVYSRKHQIFGLEIPEWHFAIFNIADSTISIAAALIIIDFFINKKVVLEEVKT
jgi:signal peptidase II